MQGNHQKAVYIPIKQSLRLHVQCYLSLGGMLFKSMETERCSVLTSQLYLVISQCFVQMWWFACGMTCSMCKKNMIEKSFSSLDAI